MTRTHDSNGKRHTADNGLASGRGVIDPLTGERVLTVWAMPSVPGVNRVTRHLPLSQTGYSA